MLMRNSLEQSAEAPAIRAKHIVKSEVVYIVISVCIILLLDLVTTLQEPQFDIKLGIDKLSLPLPLV
jgi:hypothetical protein